MAFLLSIFANLIIRDLPGFHNGIKLLTQLRNRRLGEMSTTQVIWETLRVETPLTTISIKARTKACSLCW